MGAKADWKDEVLQIIVRLNNPAFKFPFERSALLIDYLSLHKVVPRSDLTKRAIEINLSDPDTFIVTTLANVTMAIHPKGPVPDPGGWYFHDTERDLYVLDRGFSAAWREARGLNKALGLR